ncbi:SMI1/KNR4 family protein [Gynuella sunshinyii]|uniref:Knr4/Smi1-like domain-containing protein n=1 Tax=Gynuella sunshinyii YC6258 TaxID=1445510 RepID=A0A0C5V5W7_9GAMM|nr:SMI1/KNR4 family protein [Gynuella sunshinyii]AJQ94845.1 hypothetical Protein YC6258_02807 [Gynuella sunshinyii YC6258]
MNNPAVTVNPYGEIDDKYLDRFLSELPSTPPATYLEYLRNGNGGKLKNDIVLLSGKYFCSIHEYFGLFLAPAYLSLEENYKRYRNRVSKFFLPIATDPGGNIFGISLGDADYGKIYFWNHELEGQAKSLTWLSNDFSLFISSLQERSLSDLDQILENDDKDRLRDYFLIHHLALEDVDEYGRSILERAVIKGASHCIKLLYSKGAKKRNSLMLARRNARFFEKHKEIVKLIEDIYGTG